MENMVVNKAYLYQKIADYNQKVAEQSPEDMAGLVGWPKIMAKAQRLRKAGMVELTANQPNYVSANVTGDHGSYISEIWRENPESQKISNWQCTCPWFQYAFGRTRQWKKLEGRTCHLPNTLISMKNGSYKKIQDIQKGDEVVTHDGYGTVISPMSKQVSEKIYHIYRWGSYLPISVTGNHEIYSIKTPDQIRKWNESHPSDGFRIYNTEFLNQDPSWINAEDLKENDWIILNWADINNIEVDLNEAKIFGYYLAEGNLADKNKNGEYKEIQWTFNKNESELIEDLWNSLEQIDLKPRKYFYTNKNSICVRVSSVNLANKMLLWGNHLASKKELSSEVMSWKKEAKLAFLKAYSSGDGHLAKDGRQFIYTSSQNLAYQLHDFILNCGFLPFLTKSNNNMGPSNREGKTIIYKVSWKWDKKRTQANGLKRIDSNYILSKIKKIEIEDYSGLVYNMSVSDQQSYVANHVVTHNCSHVLATYWEGLSQPLSVEQPQQQPPQEPEMEIPDAPANYQNLQQTRNFPTQAPVQGDTGYLQNPDTQRMTRTIEDALKYGSRYYNRNNSSGGSYYHGSRDVNNFIGKYTQKS